MNNVKKQRHINDKGLTLVKEFESCELEAYCVPLEFG